MNLRIYSNGKKRRKFINVFSMAVLVINMSISGVFFVVPSALASDTGLKSPAANAQNGSGDLWTNPANAYTNGSGAASDNDGERHRFYNFGFGLPAGASIDGIEAKIDSWSTDSSGCQIGVDLSWNGGSNWSNEKNQSLTGNENTYTLGGSSDLWGSHDWQLSDFSDANFRARVRDIDPGYNCSNDANTNLDLIQVKVHYTEPVQPAANPELSQSCGIDMVLVIDTSSSIDNTELNQMRGAYVTFINAFLPETPTSIAVVSFDDAAVLRQGFTDNIGTLTSAINTSDGDGYTNWESAIKMARGLFTNNGKPHLIIFSSDGNSTASDTGGPSDINQPNDHLDPAITEANLAKADSIRVITLGIGGDVSNANLADISSADAVYTSNFGTLANTLADISDDLCGGTVTVKKYLDGVPAGNWEYSAVVTDGSATPASGFTDQNGYLVFEINVSDTLASVDITETMQAGFRLDSANCVNESQQPVGTLTENTITGLEVGQNDAFYCEFYNKLNYCGDSLINGEETCDLGQANGMVCQPEYGSSCNYCTDSCQTASVIGSYCGDGEVNGDEICEVSDTDACADQTGYTGVKGCKSDCSGWSECIPQENCGDGIKNGGEECDQDDGVLAHYTCSASCTLEYQPFCGDQLLNQDSEQCDGAAPVTCTTTEGYAGTAACSDGCAWGECVTEESCGDGVQNGAEACDLGQVNGLTCETGYGATCDYCTVTCEQATVFGPFCGDKVKNGDEQCDFTDGVGEHQTCSIQCVLENLAYCGDQTCQTEENCEICPTDCGSCGGGGPVCGNQIKETGEECDGTDGVGEHQTCTTGCVLENLPFCGDQTCGYEENCETCASDCGSCGSETSPVCGNQITESGEQCDDGNASSGDGCSAQCTTESGGGTPVTSSGGSSGSFFLYDNQGASAVPAPQPTVAGEAGSPVLTISKLADRTSANPGEKNMVYTVTVANTGNLTAFVVKLKDILPTGLSFADSAEASKEMDLSDMAPGASQEIKFTVNVDKNAAPKIYTNTAEVIASNHAAVSASADLNVRAVAVLAETGFSWAELIILASLLLGISGAVIFLQKKYHI